MSDVGIILAVVGFALGSIQYQIRIGLQDAKENILRVTKHYYGRGEKESLSLYSAIELMRNGLKKPNLSGEERKGYGVCMRKYDAMNALLRFFGIYVPLGALGIYFILKINFQ